MSAEPRALSQADTPAGIVSVVLAGQPLPSPRPRVMRTGTTYMPPDYVAHRELLAWEFKRAMRGEPPVAVPVELEMTFERSDRRRVDIDNLVKTCMDAATGVLFVDDSLVVDLRATKQLGCEKARTVVVMRWRA
jgi:crossover junction endodeoxyribonuclease RusA